MKMRKIIALEHISLDGFAAGPNGEMDWIRVDDEIFDVVSKVTDEADAAIFGRITYQMMEGYWPTAADQPGASKHDIEHAQWLNDALKIVASRTLKTTNWNNSRIIPARIEDEIKKLKQQPGKNLVVIGSLAIVQTLLQTALVDELWININPVILGNGVPLFFKDTGNRINLELITEKKFKCGVVGLHYAVKS
jgi:dihydrofolate reductase